MANGQGRAFTRRATLAAGVAGFGATAFGGSAKAQAAPRTFVLVHGSWHGGWCWEKTASLLVAKGHKVIAPDLPGHGDDNTSTATVTLESYADRICTIASTQKEAVVLAGHSMGGVVITQAAEKCPEHVAALVYICAFLPRNGESLMTWAMQDRESMVNPKTTEPRSEGVVAFRREHAREAFYLQCSDEEVALALSRLVDQSTAPFGTPVVTTAAPTAMNNDP